MNRKSTKSGDESNLSPENSLLPTINAAFIASSSCEIENVFYVWHPLFTMVKSLSISESRFSFGKRWACSFIPFYIDPNIPQPQMKRQMRSIKPQQPVLFMHSRWVKREKQHLILSRAHWFRIFVYHSIRFVCCFIYQQFRMESYWNSCLQCFPLCRWIRLEAKEK